MRFTQWLPKPLQRFVRERMTIYVYTYGFRPSTAVKEQALQFAVSGRVLTAKADYRTPLYDMIAEVVDYDAYQLRQLQWGARREHHILDIGANVGVTSLLFSQIPGARVTCYEPDPGNCALLRENLALNGITNARVIQAAITTVNGTVQFQRDKESTGGHVARGRLATNDHRIAVRAMRLDSVLEEYPGQVIDLLKCDCEGDEYAIVDQITAELAARIRNVTLEVHDLDRRRNLQTISAHLSKLGYQLSCKPDMWERSALHLLLARRV